MICLGRAFVAFLICIGGLGSFGRVAGASSECRTVIGGARGDRLGRAVSNAGDVNGDGLEDAVVGAAKSSRGGADTGAAFVVLGRTHEAIVDLGSNAPGALVIKGASPGALAGRSVAGAGDVNGDGFGDVIVGAPRETGPRGETGAAYVVFGGYSKEDVDLRSDGFRRGFTIRGAADGDRAGYSVAAAGDVNDDGLDDVIIGAPASSAAAPGGGAAYVVFGDASGRHIDLGSTSLAGFTVLGTTQGGRVGHAVAAAGDVNSDGVPDVMVGAPYSSETSQFAGAAYVVFGKPDTLPVNTSLLQALRDGFAIHGSARGDEAGWSVGAAGDLDGDGFDDVVVGARLADPSGRWNAGAAYGVFGGASKDVVLSAEEHPTFEGSTPFALAGSSVSATHDIDEDGDADLLVAAPRTSSPFFKGGAVHAVTATARGNRLDFVSTQESSIFALADRERLGWSLDGDIDFDGDAHGDILVGIPGRKFLNRMGSGSVCVMEMER